LKRVSEQVAMKSLVQEYSATPGRLGVESHAEEQRLCDAPQGRKQKGAQWV
jgi:hypothetical protein